MARIVKRDELRTLESNVRPVWGQLAPGSGAPEAAATPQEAAPTAPATERAADQMAEELHRLRSLVHQLAAEVVTAREELRRHAQQEVIELATAVAEKVVGREIAQAPDVVVNAVQTALEVGPQTPAVTVHLNPDDVELVRGAGDMLLSHRGGSWELVPDPGVQPGGCVLETSLGLVDARVEARLLTLQRALEEGL